MTRLSRSPRICSSNAAMRVVVSRGRSLRTVFLKSPLTASHLTGRALENAPPGGRLITVVINRVHQDLTVKKERALYHGADAF